MNIFKKKHITHCFILYVIIFFLSIFALLKISHYFRYDWADTIYNGITLTSNFDPVILREDVEAMNKKLKDVFPNSAGIYVTFEGRSTKVIHIGDYFSRCSEDDRKIVDKMMIKWFD